MLQKIDLRELAEMHGNGRDFVSVYFPGSQGIAAIKSRERTVRDLLEDDADEAEHFELSMQMIRDLLEENPTEAEGICVFACGLLDFVRGYPLPLPVEPQLHVGPTPYIRPMAELQDEYQTFAMLACENDGTRIYLVTEESAEVEEKVRGGVKNHVRKGGWSQQRYERRRDNQLQHYAEQVAKELGDIVKQHKLDRIVLLGSTETMREIEDVLPRQLAELVVGRQAFDLNRGADEMLEEAYEMYFASEREEEAELWQRIKNEYKRHGLAVAGPTEVLAAVQQGRVATLLITRDAKLHGTHCRDCDTTVHGTPKTCQNCGSTSVFEVDLVDILTQQAQLTSAYVEFSDPIPGLTKVKDVAALLRY